MKLNLLKLSGIAFLLCFSTNGFTQNTPGTLTFSFTPISQTSGNYSGTKNVMAIWIENATTGAFIKTKARYVGGGTEDHLPTWGSKCGCSNPNAVTATTTTGCNVTDATTGATLASYTAKSITWDGKNVSGILNGSVVPDGSYQVTVQETWGHGSATVLRSFVFTKGPNSDHQTPVTDAKFSNIKLDWVPTALGTDNVSPNAKVVIYPNPTKGVINIDFINEINKIIVSNILGQIVYDENVAMSVAGTTKSIDLSSFGSGIYIVTVSNNDETSNYRVVIDK